LDNRSNRRKASERSAEGYAVWGRQRPCLAFTSSSPAPAWPALGLGDGWTCLFANDFDTKKGLTYQANWGTGGELTVGDVRKIKPADLVTRHLGVRIRNSVLEKDILPENLTR
jgi:hypothetical protein